MRCKEVQDYLALYQRGLLGNEMAARVEGHLASCTDCQEVLAQETRITEGLDAVFTSAVGEIRQENLAEWVLEQAHGEGIPVHRDRSRTRFVFRFGAVAATVVLAFWLSFFFRHHQINEVNVVQDASIRTVSLMESPVRNPEIREVQRKTTVTRLKKNIIWISYTN